MHQRNSAIWSLGLLFANFVLASRAWRRMGREAILTSVRFSGTRCSVAEVGCGLQLGERRG